MISAEVFEQISERRNWLVLRCIGVDFGVSGGPRPLGSDTEGGEICLAPSVFWQVIPTWLQEIWNFELR